MLWQMVTLKTGTCQHFLLSSKKTKQNEKPQTHYSSKGRETYAQKLQWSPASLKGKVQVSMMVLRGPNDLPSHPLLPYL